ncbi:cysteine hydrolase family protein [Crenobacter caeni]|uniref:Cysteine hydrolase n=1 Tax=Crenobacter caeni TaxID=2705474 RepID=A0A6B2KQK4_9NEIS|nr:cysteine hydrolase [Crenobacter caeni]NDV12259.1 cysteine hydrolase [Crenobacter caeni]
MSTAFVGLDYIVDVMGEGGHPARCQAEAARREVVRHANQAAAFCRARGWPVIWVRVGFSPGYPEWPAASPLFGGARDAGAFLLGAPGTAFVPELAVQAGDVVLAKPRVSGFYGTALEAVLRARGVTRLIVSGVSTSLAVSSTVRDAHDRDYAVYLLEDACAAASEAEHSAGLLPLPAIARIIRCGTLASLA